MQSTGQARLTPAVRMLFHPLRRTFVNVGLEIPNFVGIILPTPLKSFVNSLSNIRKPLFYRFMFIHP